MENIKILLNKIGELSTVKNELRPIEMDMLLAYTRQLYDLFLTQKMAMDDKTIKKQRETDNAPVETAPEQPDKQVETQNNIGQTEQETPQEIIKNDLTTETDSDIAPKTNTEPTLAEEKTEQAEFLTQPSYDFEPPHTSEKEPEFPAEGIEEEKPEAVQKHADTTLNTVQEAETSLPDYTQIFNYQPVTEKPAKDIRDNIGINDRYLFLNELFNNQKQAYEQALDQINKKQDYQAAEKWIKENIASKYQWYQEDETVTSFYEVLHKHFSFR